MNDDELWDECESAMKRRVAHIWSPVDDLTMELFARKYPDVFETMRKRVGLELKRPHATLSSRPLPS